MARELVIYADESEQKGRYFSNFFGGALVESRCLQEVIDRLTQVKAEQHLGAEVKWQKVTDQYLAKYEAFVRETFDLVREGKLKMRIMFTKNSDVPDEATRANSDESFSKLYYQFLKHAFGLQYAGSSPHAPVRIRLYLDELPDVFDKNERLKDFVVGLNGLAPLAATAVRFDREQIAEVASHDHVVLQALDIVLGSMPFRLNDKHLEKPAGSHRRGKRTIAKEKLYRLINREIQTLRTGFNVGESTGRDAQTSAWDDPYRHWKFRPKKRSYDPTKNKP